MSITWRDQTSLGFVVPDGSPHLLAAPADARPMQRLAARLTHLITATPTTPKATSEILRRS
jgi:hypothetical protein